jgi:hypothetical protein
MIGFIIFGTRGVTTTVDRGRFHCPACGSPQPYRLRRVRRFFEIYFIPLIPLDKLGEYVECGTCGRQFREEVLRYAPGEEDAQAVATIAEVLRKVIVAGVRTRGSLGPDGRDRAVEIYRRLTGETPADEEVNRALVHVNAGKGNVVGDLGRLAPGLTEEGKETIVHAAVLAAMEETGLTDSGKAYVVQVAEALGMTRAHLRGIIDEMFSEGT